MKPKTEELLYFLLWSCDRLMQPTFRNLTDSFESWAYSNGLSRQVAELERRKFLESAPRKGTRVASLDRVIRLTETGRLRDHAAARSFRRWAAKERAGWQAAVAEDPLLPEALLPRDYLGRKVWKRRMKVLQKAARQVHPFKG